MRKRKPGIVNHGGIRPACIFILAAFAFCLTACAPKVGENFHFFNDDKNHMYVFYPAQDESAPAPLLMVLHGYDGQALSAATVWRMQKGIENFHILAPQAPMKKKGRRVVSTWTGSSDESYLLKLMDKIAAEANVDSKRIAVAGYSSGASMAMRMALKYPSRFNACVCVGAGLSLSDTQRPENLNVFLLAGQRDRGFNGNKVKSLAAHLERRGAQVKYEIVPNADHAGLYNKIGPAAVWLVDIFKDGPALH